MSDCHNAQIPDIVDRHSGKQKQAILAGCLTISFLVFLLSHSLHIINFAQVTQMIFIACAILVRPIIIIIIQTIYITNYIKSLVRHTTNLSEKWQYLIRPLCDTVYPPIRNQLSFIISSAHFTISTKKVTSNLVASFCKALDN